MKPSHTVALTLLVFCDRAPVNLRFAQGALVRAMLRS